MNLLLVFFPKCLVLLELDISLYTRHSLSNYPMCYLVCYLTVLISLLMLNKKINAINKRIVVTCKAGYI